MLITKSVRTIELNPVLINHVTYRLRLVGHVASIRMRFWLESLEGKTTLNIKRRWEDNIKSELGESVGGVDWINLAWDREP